MTHRRCNVLRMPPSAPASDQTWPQRLALQIGRNIQHARRDRRVPMTAAELAERCTGLGHEMSRSQVASIEVGRKGVALSDLLVICAALGVPLPWLLAPAGADWAEEVEILPGTTPVPERTYGWLAGRGPGGYPMNGGEDVQDELDREWERRTDGAELSAQHWAWSRAWAIFDEDGGPEPDVRVLKMIRRRMRVAGLLLPGLPRGITAAMVDISSNYGESEA